MIFNNGSTSLENIQVVLEHNQREVASTVIEKLDPGEYANKQAQRDHETGAGKAEGRFVKPVFGLICGQIVHNALVHPGWIFTLNRAV